jgi:deoxyribonuclease IV
MPLHDFRFGTVGSPISTPKKPGGSVGGVLRIAELGLDSLELGWVRSVRVSAETCQAIKGTALSTDIALSVHAPYYINLNSDDEEWPKSRQRLMDSAYYGDLAGATDIIFHPGSYFNQPHEQVMTKVIGRLQGCIDELRSSDNPVTLRPETMGKLAMIGSLEDTLELSQAVSGVKPCLDFAHLHARTGDSSMNSYDEWCQLLELYAGKLGENSLRDLHIHLSGIEYGEKGEKEHLPLQDADLDLEAILRALKSFGCGGRILCESPVLEDDALLIKNTWLELIEN